ncbi:hypothetical protein Ocin01_04588, partial [Orchesella cincta]
MATEATRRRRNTSQSSDSSFKNGWDYFVTIKWLVLALIISLGCVYLLDLVGTVTSSLLKKNGFDRNKKSDMYFGNDGDAESTKSFPWGAKGVQNSGEVSKELRIWLEENDLLMFSDYFKRIGVVTLVSVTQLDQLTHELGIDIASLASSNNNAGDQPAVSHLSPVSSEELPPINLSGQDRERLRRAAHILRQRLILRLWLDDHGLMDYAP